MANGYGYGGSPSTSSSSSSPSAPSVPASPSSVVKSVVYQNQVAPPGFHYMPDGTLMSDAEHEALYNNKQIAGILINLSDLPAATTRRSFQINGTDGAEFILEIKNEDDHYYNFITRAFQATKSSLEKTITNGSYVGYITFPTVTDDDNYDIYLYAKPGSQHSEYNEVRFQDGSIDVNSSSGSNSLMLQKVIYQYTDLTLTLSTISPSATIETASQSNATITTSRRFNKVSTAFSISCSVSTATKSYRVIKQPTSSDALSFTSLTVGSAPEALTGEDIYPAVSNTDTVDGNFAGGVANVKIVMDTNVADKMVVGDKITAPIISDTVNGASDGIKVIVDTGKMQVGDQVGGNEFLEKNFVTVTELDPDGDNAFEFNMSRAVTFADGDAITFSHKCNRSLTTVVALNPDGDNVKEFSMSQNIGITDATVLSFSNQKNYQWPVNDIKDVFVGATLLSDTNVTASSIVDDYYDYITVNENTEEEIVLLENKSLAVNTKGQKPTITKGLVSTQPGSLVFNNQQALALAGDTLRVGSYNTQGISSISGYNVKFTNLAIALTPITTTTTSAVSNSTSVPVASRNGILDSVSTVSGIGINPALADPTVSSGAGAVSGAGTLVLSAAQTLEDGITLAFANAGQQAVITGNIEIISAGIADKTIHFDVEKLLSIT